VDRAHRIRIVENEGSEDSPFLVTEHRFRDASRFVVWRDVYHMDGKVLRLHDDLAFEIPRGKAVHSVHAYVGR
jgi:hypothetical protein